MAYNHQTMLACTEQVNVKFNVTDSYKTEVGNTTLHQNNKLGNTYMSLSKTFKTYTCNYDQSDSLNYGIRQPLTAWLW